MIYTLDTNVIIHLLRETPAVLERYEASLLAGYEIVISPPADYEIRRGFLCKPAVAKERAYDELCSCCPVGEMTVAIWHRAARIYAELRKAHYTLEDADILIAAFAIEGGYTLVTGNVKHFERVDGLMLEDWTR